MNNLKPLIDTHCHVDMILEKGLSFDEMELGLIESNVKAVVQIASDPAAMEFSSAFCHEKSGKVQYYYTIGLHPNEAHELDTSSGINSIINHSDDSRLIAVGEVGLDFFYGLEHRDIQMKTFEMYLDIAVKFNKPIVIHTRNAHDETIHFIKQYSGNVPFLIHCFTGNTDQLKDYLDLGACISFSGIVTFKNANDIRDAALYCPVDKMVVETDSPFLAPVPNRGQVNKPYWVKNVADFLCDLKGADIRTNLFNNSINFFNLPII